jgi:hypothetical protein
VVELHTAFMDTHVIRRLLSLELGSKLYESHTIVYIILLNCNHVCWVFQSRIPVLMCSTSTGGAGHDLWRSFKFLIANYCQVRKWTGYLCCWLTPFSHFVLQFSSYQQWWVPWWIEQQATIGLQLPSLRKSSRLYLQFCRVAVVSSFPLCL